MPLFRIQGKAKKQREGGWNCKAYFNHTEPRCLCCLLSLQNCSYMIIQPFCKVQNVHSSLDDDTSVCILIDV